MKKNSGFTLTELLIVFMIIGLLAAIAVPSFINARKRSELAKQQEAQKPDMIEKSQAPVMINGVEYKPIPDVVVLDGVTYRREK